MCLKWQIFANFLLWQISVCVRLCRFVFILCSAILCWHISSVSLARVCARARARVRAFLLQSHNPGRVGQTVPGTVAERS